MTIVASVKVRDGLVLGTDSMTQITTVLPTGEAVLAKSYSNARKLFELTPARAGVMTWGLGNIGDHSCEGLVREFRQSLEDGMGIPDIAQALFDFISPRWQTIAGPTPDHRFAIGFCVAGYSPDAPFAEAHEFVLPRDAGPVAVSSPESFGLLWRGIDHPLLRLIKGWDPRLVELLQAEGISAEHIEAVLASLEWFLYQPGMPLQDAVNLVEYLLNTTIGVSSFVEPNPTCGGPLQVAAILPDRGFTWINRPPLALPPTQSLSGDAT